MPLLLISKKKKVNIFIGIYFQATEFSDMILVFGISLGYSSLLAGLTLGEDSYTTIDGSVNESNYLPEKKNQQVVECWYTASKVSFF